MTQRSRTYLKAKFETGDIPTATDYADLIDSFLNLEASASQSMAGSLVLPSINVSGASIRSNQVLSPTGTTQASAASISLDIVAASAEQLERAVVLPALTPGRTHFVVNTGTTVLAVFPFSGENFVGTAANGGIELAVSQGMHIFHVASAYAYVR